MKRLEHALQIAVAHMLQIVLDPDEIFWTAIDHGVGKLGVVEASQRKKRGVKAGLPDFIILKAVIGAYPMVVGIELKSAKGNLSSAQLEVATAWHRLGHEVYIARSLEDVQMILDTCLVPTRRRMTFFSGGGHERLERPAAARDQRPQRRRKSKSRLPVVLARAP